MAENVVETTFGTYLVRTGCEGQFEQLLPRSWALLRRLGFIHDEDPVLFRSVATPRVYVELVKWRPGVMDPAHEHPDVIPVWVQLARLVEPRTPHVLDRGLNFEEFLPVVPVTAS